MTDSLLRRALNLDTWHSYDIAHGPGCKTDLRMNEIRELLVDIAARLEQLDNL